MKLKKMTAVAMAATMVLGNSMIVLADEAVNGATGTGTAFEHLNKEIITVTLPLDSQVENVFNYYVDPERLVNEAEKLANGTDATANADGVYFSVDSDFASTSAAVSFEGNNSVAVDVTVAATVESADTDIALVADADALAAATAAKTPALLMTLNVGDESVAITENGGSTKATIAGVEDNFEVTVGDDGYEYTIISDPADWNSVDVTLSGKTNNVDVTEGMTAPTISLTWTVAKHVDSYFSSLSIGSAGVTLNLPEGTTITSVVLNKGVDNDVVLASGNTYTLSGTTFTVKSAIIEAYPGKTVTVTFSDGTSEVLTIA